MGEVLSNFSFDLPWIAALVVAAGLYLYAFAKDRKSGRESKQPWWRLGSFFLGLLAVATAVVSPLEHYGNQAVWVNFLGFLVLTMIGAPLLVLSAPITLAFRTSSKRGRSVLRHIMRSFPVRVVTFPIFSWLAFAVFTYVWQFTTLTDDAAQNHAVRDVQLATLLLVSVLFWFPALCSDPQPWRLAFPLRALYVFVEMTHKGLFGGMFLSSNHAWHHYYASHLPSWAPSALTDQRIGILILWIGGNMIFIVALLAILIQWMAYEKRKEHRTDYHLEAAREAERRRQAALEQVFQKGI